MLQDFFEDMKKLIKKKDKAAIKRNYQSMYERMLNYSKPETQSARGGKSKTTQESGKTFRHRRIQREGTGGQDPPWKITSCYMFP